MDIKIGGLSAKIMEEALAQARRGRLHILQEMARTMSIARPELKEGVPRIESLKIDQDKIGMLIGPGGKNIKAIQETFAVTIEVEEDGTVKVLGSDVPKIRECMDVIRLQLVGPKIGTDYLATVVSIKDYGAFVDLAPGVSGLVHVSEFSNDRVQDPNDYVSAGDKIMVRVVEVDRMGRIKLSAKAVQSIAKKA
jgi:polyribonucleotide nucleotidyltransferase